MGNISSVFDKWGKRMNRSKRLAALIVLTVIFCFGQNKEVYAYLDFSTGSFIYQFIISGIISLGFIIKIYGGKIKNLFKNNQNKNDDK